MSEEPKQARCPNCLGPAVKEGNTIICEVCDATYAFTKKGGAKLKEVGRLDSFEKRLDRLDSLFPIEEPDPAKLEPDPAKLEPDPDDDDDSILGD